MRLPQAVAARLLERARDTAPREACGVLLEGRDGAVRLVDLPNLAAGPGRFEVDPGALLGALREAHGRGERLAAFWHTHPGSSALPGGADEAGAWKEVPTLVCAPLAVPPWRLWRFSHGCFSEVPLDHEDVPTADRAARSRQSLRPHQAPC